MMLARRTRDLAQPVSCTVASECYKKRVEAVRLFGHSCSITVMVAMVQIYIHQN